jgi:hypothetical protein
MSDTGSRGKLGARYTQSFHYELKKIIILFQAMQPHRKVELLMVGLL